MQSFGGRIRLVGRHTLSSSNVAHLKHPLSGSSGFSYLEANCSVSNGSVDWNSIGCLTGRFLGSLSKFASRSLTKIDTQTLTSSSDNGVWSVSSLYQSPRSSAFGRASVMYPFPSRCMTTMGNFVDSNSEKSSDPVPDLAPRIKFKRLDKTAKHIMQILDKEAVEEVREKREIPDIKPGYIVQLKVEVPDNKRRVSILKGIVIARRNAGLNTTFRIRRLVAGVGVESLFPLYSPNIKEIKVLDKKKVKRAKLYYLRDKMNALKKH